MKKKRINARDAEIIKKLERVLRIRLPEVEELQPSEPAEGN